MKESSETTGLLLAQGDDEYIDYSRTGSSLEFYEDNLEEDGDDHDFLQGLDLTQFLVPSRSKRATPVIRTALVAILICGVAVRLLGSISSQQVSPRGSAFSSSYWDDEAHQHWQEYMTNSNSNSNLNSQKSSFSMMTASASLVGSVASTSSSSSSVATTTGTSSSTDSLLYFNQTSAFAMLDPGADFYHYQNGWDAQITQALCAVATTAALLNSFRDVGPDFVLPMDPIYKPFPWATQADLLGEAVDNKCVIEALGGTLFNQAAVYHMGLGLAMVPKLANCFLKSNGFKAHGHPAIASEKDTIKALVLEALADPSQRVVYNYDRGGIGQGPMGHGHWSPLGGYNKATDSFLVMDVAKYKHPMVWVHWDDLWSGAATVDPCGQTLSLGYVDWSHRDLKLYDYLRTRCIPGSRGFVVVKPVEGEL